MDDQHRQPRESDRNPVRDRIKRAVAAGRISSADGEIRLTNVASAQSIGELGLIVRDLDQLESVIQGGTPVAPTPVTAFPGAQSGPASVAAATGAGVRRTLPMLILGLAIAIIAAGAIGVFVFSSSGGSGSATETSEVDLPDALPVDPEMPVDACPTWPECDGEPGEAPGEDPGEEPAEPEDPVTPYRLDAAGIKGFLVDYRERFGTTRVVDLTFYPEYVIVRAPIGKNRNTGWRYADGQFSEFGPAMANFPGSATIDAAKLDRAKLFRNIATARRTLNVEDGQVTHVSLSYRPAFDDEPNVNIYVGNEFSEGGYLATVLDGRIERSYPFGG